MKVGTDAVLLGAWTETNAVSRVLDIGSGSGVIALMTAQRTSAQIVGVDIDFSSVEEAKHNAENSEWSNRIQFYCTDIQQFCEEKNKQAFDLIVSNPPFFVNSLKSPTVGRNQSRHTDTLSFNDLINSVLHCLSENGSFAVILPHIHEELIENLCLQNRLFCYRKLRICPKEGKNIHRVLLQFKRKKETLRQENLSIRNAENNYTDAYKELTKAFYL
ncbi:MAG: methyltransferase domain-containing protein [Lentimicrobiaceae bacterium]|nr:methyltransferase domain-containing protein [Lentimicrobiaceae bacterium]